MESTELMHYGVKGMKWGVRRAQKRVTKYRKKAAQYDRYSKEYAKEGSRRYGSDGARQTDGEIAWMKQLAADNKAKSRSIKRKPINWNQKSTRRKSLTSPRNSPENALPRSPLRAQRSLPRSCWQVLLMIFSMAALVRKPLFRLAEQPSLPWLWLPVATTSNGSISRVGGSAKYGIYALPLWHQRYAVGCSSVPEERRLSDSSR